MIRNSLRILQTTKCLTRLCIVCRRCRSYTRSSKNSLPFVDFGLAPLARSLSKIDEDEIGAVYTRETTNCGIVVVAENGPIVCLTTSLYQLCGAA